MMKYFIISTLLLSLNIFAQEIPSVNPGDAISAQQINALIAKVNAQQAFIDNLKTNGRYVVKKFSSPRNFWEIYNDGWVRQTVNFASASVDTSGSFLIQMKDTDYSIYAGLEFQASSGDSSVNVYANTRTTTGVSLNNQGVSGGRYILIVEGYGASSVVTSHGATPNY